MSTSLATAGPTPPAARRPRPDRNHRLRALRAAGDPAPGAVPGLPTGWGRWPTCACPRESRAADGSCS